MLLTASLVSEVSSCVCGSARLLPNQTPDTFQQSDQLEDHKQGLVTVFKSTGPSRLISREFKSLPISQNNRLLVIWLLYISAKQTEKQHVEKIISATPPSEHNENPVEQ